MSKPKNITPEQEATRKEKNNERSRKWREAHPERRKALQKAYQDKNREVIRAKAKAHRVQNNEAIRLQEAKERKVAAKRIKAAAVRYYQKNREAILQREANYRRDNKGKKREIAQEAIVGLKDHYLASQLRLPVATLRQHPDLLNAIREHRKALRQLKNQTETNNAQESK